MVSGRIGNFLTALMNEMRVLGVTTLYTLEVPDIMGPAIRSPIGDLSSLVENLILLRFVEVHSRLYRLISLLKVRDSDFDQTLHEYATSNRGADHRGQRRERRADHDNLLSPKGG
jgi:circadian clock protein KaiC